MEDEITNLKVNGTYELVPLYKVQKMKADRPTEISLGYTHFVNKCKTMDGGEGMSVFDKLKSRLVYQGNYSVQFVDWLTSHAPACKMDSTRICFALATIFDLHCFCGDFNYAFLQAPSPNKHMYARFPHGYKMMVNGVEHCMHLKKNLYGMVDAARNWFKELEHWLLKDCPFKFTQMGSDQCVFWCQVGLDFMILFLYVDDVGLLTTSVRLKDELFKAISARFAFEDKGIMEYFLGMKFTRDREAHSSTLDMKAYIRDKLNLFKLEGKRTYASPIIDGDLVELGESLEGEKATEYRAMVGALLWVGIVRPDICHAVGKLSQHMAKPTEGWHKQAQRCWQYLGGTIHEVLTYSLAGANEEALMGVGYISMPEGGECVVSGYVDANLKVPKSTTGLAFKMGGGTVVAKSKMQPVTAIQTYDAEYYAMSSAMLVAIWFNMYLKEINHLFKMKFGKDLINGPVVLYGDNAAVVKMMQEKAISNRARHIALRWHHMMGSIKAGLVEPHSIKGELNPSDCLTKALNGIKTKLMRDDMLGLKLMNKMEGKKVPKHL